MKFIYCYVERYREIHNQQYNFDSEYNFELDNTDKVLYINKNDNYQEDFFSKNNNLNIKALVGKNGTGKSTILNLLKHMFITGFVVDCNKQTNWNNIFITEEDNELIIYISKWIFENVNIFYGEKMINEDRSILFYELETKNIKFKLYDVLSKTGITNDLRNNNVVIGPILHNSKSLIYYSNQYDFNWSNFIGNKENKIDYIDISLNNRIYIEPQIKNKYFNYEAHLQNPDDRFVVSYSQKYLNQDIENKVNFLSKIENRDYIQKYFQVPPYIYITLDYMSSNKSMFFLDIERENLLRYEKDKSDNFIIENLIYEKLNDNSSIKAITISTFLKRIIDSYFVDIEKFLFFKLSVEEFKKYERNKFSNGNELKGDDILEYLSLIKKVFNNFIRENELIGDVKMIEFKGGFEKITNLYFSFIQYLINDFFLQEFLEYEPVTINKNVENKDGVMSLIMKEEGIIKIETSIKNISTMNKLFEEYRKLDTLSEFLVFDWGALSLGEENLFSFLSELERSILKAIHNNMLILVDEGDLTLHPEWQRKYVSIFIDFLNTKLDSKKIQIFITTHSPLVMSDLPINNIILLEKNTESVGIPNGTQLKNSFGANIHNLYRYGQFLDSTTGEFAVKKIEKVLKFINSDEEMESSDFQESYNKALKIIRIIGEPKISRQLIYMLEEKQKKFLNKSFNNNEAQTVLEYLKQMQQNITNEINYWESKDDSN